jgi:uncharacterized protein (DUF736 family)
MQIGQFKQIDDDTYTGHINTLTLAIHDIQITAVLVKQSNAAPDFIVLRSTLYEIGAAWKKTSKSGKPYLSVKLDDPVFTEPIHCALIKQHDHYALIWKRDAALIDIGYLKNPLDGPGQVA